MDKEKVLLAISEADDDFIEDILTAAMKRKHLLNPGWEIRYLAVPRDASVEERHRYERAWQVLTERRAYVMTPPYGAEIWVRLLLKNVYRRLYEKNNSDL